jgi:NAD-reducing hydrogenase large subunit
MGQRIVIDPVTRIEGHAKITIQLGDDGQVADARFHVAEFRGFERFCVGRPLWEMAGITARVCGICPVSHLIASAKTGDRIMAVTPPPAAVKLRRMMNLGQIVQSHALSFFHLASPDLILGFDSDPAKRNLFGLIAADREWARGGIRLRQFGQEVIEHLGGKKIHPDWSVPGGVRKPLTLEARDALLARVPEAQATAVEALGRFKRMLDAYREEAATFGDFPSLFLGLVGLDGSWEHYDGVIRIDDSSGRIVADNLDGQHYRDFIGEATQHDNYLKFPYYKPLGYPGGIYRVGPLARLNICERMPTPMAERERLEFRDRYGTATSSFLYHYARLIEIIAGIEGIALTLDDPEILSSDRLRAQAGVNNLEGVGVSEAPRGTLFHHYKVDADGRLEWVNLVIATGQNGLAMNQTVLQIARHYITGPRIPEGVLNRLEAGIRAFDPCLSCSTHAVGMMPMHITLLDRDGVVCDEAWKD